MNDFWLMAKSPKEIVSEFLLPENPSATLWDIFTDYSLIFPENEPADTNLDWLAEQEKSILAILNSEVKGMVLTRTEIEDLCIAVEELALFEEEPVVDYLGEKLVSIAKKIAYTYLLPKKLNQATVIQFVDRLQKSLEETNADHIAKSDKESMRKMMLDIPYYSEEKKQEMVKNLEKVWEMNPNAEDAQEGSFEDDFDEEDNDYESEGYLWPEITLAHSQTFFGFDDAGNLPYEKQEELAVEKYDAFAAEITELLGEQPNPDLFPVNLVKSNDGRAIFEQFATEYLLAYEFEHKFTVWRGDGRVLFLILRKEDKELPYQLVLGGMELKEYIDVIEKYNGLGEKG